MLVQEVSDYFFLLIYQRYSVKQWLVLLQKKRSEKLIYNVVTKYSNHVRTTCSSKITQSTLNIHFSHKTSISIRKHYRWSKINDRDN
jgi:hypothetical protein